MKKKQKINNKKTLTSKSNNIYTTYGGGDTNTMIGTEQAKIQLN